ncbi:hypothetical protein ACIOHS_23510 [Streptomyces sp. NPDC088253]|uniref:hypothetical protein n=1 Tax=Streptomyces sp. NPDC088253 TaxID=3365846 RepID=UPI0037F42B90
MRLIGDSRPVLRELREAGRGGDRPQRLPDGGRRPKADVETVAVNDLGDVPSMAHPPAHDSIPARFPGEIGAGPGAIRVGTAPSRS